MVEKVSKNSAHHDSFNLFLNQKIESLINEISELRKICAELSSNVAVMTERIVWVQKSQETFTETIRELKDAINGIKKEINETGKGAILSKKNDGFYKKMTSPSYLVAASIIAILFSSSHDQDSKEKMKEVVETAKILEK